LVFNNNNNNNNSNNKGIAGKTVPYQYIPFFFDHYKMDARALMFAHEGVWDKVEEDI